MIQDIFKSILYMSLSSSFLIVAVLVARGLLQKTSKLFRKLLWGLVALKLIIPLSLESAFSLLPQQSAYMPDSGVVGGSGVVTTETFSIDASRVVPYIWLLVFVAFAVYAAVSFLKLKLKISDAVLLEGNTYQSEKVDSPFVFGIIKPKIYLPYKINGDTLDCVLMHEKTHIRYFDHITKLLGFSILCIHWFNPLVWVAYMLFCKDTELACDEAVVKNMTTEQRKGYAKALCDIGINKVRISACPVAFGEVSLKARVKSVICYRKLGKVAFVLSVVVCIVVAMCFMTSPENSNAVVKADAVEVLETVVAESTEKTEAKPSEKEITTEPVTEAHTESVVQEVSREAVTEPATDESVVEEYGEYNGFSEVNIEASEDPFPPVTLAYQPLYYYDSFSGSMILLNPRPEETEEPTTSKELDVAISSIRESNYNISNEDLSADSLQEHDGLIEIS